MQIIAEIARLETLLKKLEDGDKRKPTPPPVRPTVFLFMMHDMYTEHGDFTHCKMRAV